MPRVLLIGFDPDCLDVVEPECRGASDPDRLRHAIRSALRDMQQRGWVAMHCAVHPDETAGARVECVLASHPADCVVIGAGLRLSRRYGWVFEAVVNAVHQRAPKAAIAFGGRPEDSAEVAARWLSA